MTIQTYSLPELVDLALKTPIIGVVNFGILRTILHILIKEMGLQSFYTKLNITDMKPQILDMPAAPRRPSDIAESVERELLTELEEIEDIEGEVPESENISNLSIGEEPIKPAEEEDEECEEFQPSTMDSEEFKSKKSAETKLSEKSAETKLSEKSSETKLSEKSSETKLIDSRSVVSDTSFKGPAAFQEDMAKFWESTTVNSRITALESGLEKIVDIIDEQARDLEHFRRDTERRRAKD
ncbi:cyclin-dependent kinase 11A-like, partial [Centruroides sculpturatus]|uniref:cyclin-dependent kinase 11A-like n=1 Tax=Centruroides sculpturatus TaxID=218467 RepID=UPI000C6CEC89